MVWRYPHIPHHRFSPAKTAVETGPTSCVGASEEESGYGYLQTLGTCLSSSNQYQSPGIVHSTPYAN